MLTVEVSKLDACFKLTSDIVNFQTRGQQFEVLFACHTFKVLLDACTAESVMG